MTLPVSHFLPPTGDTEMVLELDTNIATVVSTANTEVFVLNAKNFDRLVSKKNPHTVRQLVNSVCQVGIGVTKTKKTKKTKNEMHPDFLLAL